MDGTTITAGSHPSRSWAHLACRCSGRFQRRRQVRYSLAERQRLARDLDHGRHQRHRLEPSFPILGPPGMSLQRPISTATASPIFFGRTTAACRRSGPWTAPRSLAERHPSQSWADLACRCSGRFQRRRQVRYSLAERQRLAGDLDHGRHQRRPERGRSGPNPGSDWHLL